MKFTFYTNSVSPHQLPLADELIKILGKENYRYVYTGNLTLERRELGWGNIVASEWCEYGNDTSVELRESNVLMSGHRAIGLFEYRVRDCKKTIYCSERWFKPIIGILRLLRPSYFRMARRFVRLLSSASDFHYYPIGIHAARDMARLCGMMHGDLRCLFRAPRLAFERKPGGQIWLKSGNGVRRYCLDKMQMWGYYVEPSRFDSSLDRTVNETSSNEVKVLWVGRLLKLKRVDTIIRAVSWHAKLKCKDNSLPRITLDIYGVGPEENRLKKMAAKHGELIKFHSPVPLDEVRKLMRKHDVYVLSSNEYEGWGAVVSEALEEGMKVIGTYEAGASATMLPESNLFHSGDWRRLRSIIANEIKMIGIGAWTAKSAARELVTFSGRVQGSGRH